MTDAPRCEARSNATLRLAGDEARWEYGRCGERRGLRFVTAADGTQRGYCVRDGHQADVTWQFPPEGARSEDLLALVARR